MKWTPTHIQILLWLAFQDVKTRNANSKTISEWWPDVNGEAPSPRAIQEKLTAIKNGVEDLGMAEFFGNGGVSAPRRKPASSQRNSNNAKDIVRLHQAAHQGQRKRMPATSSELQIQDVPSNQRQIHAPAVSNADERDDISVTYSNIDGETATESDTDSDIIVLKSQPVQRRRASRPNYSLPRQDNETGISNKSRLIQKQPRQVHHVESQAPGIKYELERADDVSTPAMELRNLPKRTYRGSPDVEFNSDSEPNVSERQRKKPRIRLGSPVEVTESEHATEQLAHLAGQVTLRFSPVSVQHYADVVDGRLDQAHRAIVTFRPG